MVLTVDGIDHLLLRRDGHSVQLACDGLTIQPEEEYLPYYELAGFEELETKLLTLKRFKSIYCLRQLSRRLFPLVPHNRRLRFVLQALDGHLAGASYREIALALLGEKRVLANWSNPDRSLRHQIKSSVQRGLYLMREGYRQFLK